MRATQWHTRRTREELGQCLFTFVVIADTHVDQEDGPLSSPFPVNAHANARTRFCVADIARLSRELGPLTPRFVLHLGDLIHPVPSMPGYATAAADFKSIMAPLDVPCYVIPGNHDVGDKPVDWAPAGVVRDEYLDLWNEHFGVHYQSFDVADCHFVLLNAQIINSGLDLEAEQARWLDKDLAAAANRRLFVSLHYPPYVADRDEDEHYDNIAEPGRTWFLELLHRHQVEALFAGHVHHFWYNRHEQTDCYLFPSTSFTRQDYSEMFRAPPSPDMGDGRDDIEKVGYFLVTVYENGHACHFRRTQGCELAPQGVMDSPTLRLAPCTSREIPMSGLGFEMRHPWAEYTEIAPSGALDEFQRKRVRNDYPVLALWDMGVTRIRIPLADLREKKTRERMQALRHNGQRFTVISHGLPDRRAAQDLVRHAGLIDAWELAVALRQMPEASARVCPIVEASGIALFLSKIRDKNDVVRAGEPYYHVIQHGFVPGDAGELENTIGGWEIGRSLTGIVMRVARDQQPWEVWTEAMPLADSLGVALSLSVAMGPGNPAARECDNLANANRIAEALLLACAEPRTTVFIDTFMDHDRGHSVRNGVLDRHCNPRLGYHVVRNLHGALATYPVSDRVRTLRADNAVVLEARNPDANLRLVLPIDVSSAVRFETTDEARRQSMMLALDSGEVTPSAFATDRGAPGAMQGRLTAPVLLIDER